MQFSISFQLFDSQNPCSRPESSQKNELCCAITKVVEAKVSTTEIQFKTSNTPILTNTFVSFKEFHKKSAQLIGKPF